jgi:hypothetical protein
MDMMKRKRDTLPCDICSFAAFCFLLGAWLPLGSVLVTVDTPSTNFVQKMTLALLNIPSFNDTTINCNSDTTSPIRELSSTPKEEEDEL